MESAAALDVLVAKGGCGGESPLSLGAEFKVKTMNGRV